MDIESKFNSLGVDAITGVSLLEWLNIAPDELQIAERFSKLQYIIDYLKSLSPDTQRYLVRKVTVGKQVDRVQQVFEYVGLLEQKAQMESILDQIKRDQETVTFDPIMAESLKARESEARQHHGKILDELSLYEK